MKLIVARPIIALIFILTLFSSTYAQDQKSGYFKTSYHDLAIGASSGQFVGALSWSHLHGIGKKNKRLKLGYGLRFTSYFGTNQNYSTAPAKYTAKEEDIDTLNFKTAQSNLLNLTIQIAYSIHKKIDLGFNIDFAGLSIGGEQEAALISSVRGAIPVQQNAKPNSVNLLLMGDNDIGNLSSEFYLRYWVSEKIGIRAGINYLFTEYKTSAALPLDNGRISVDRFRNKSMMGIIAITYKPF